MKVSRGTVRVKWTGYWRSSEMKGFSRRSTSARMAAGKQSRCSLRGSLRIESMRGETPRSDM